MAFNLQSVEGELSRKVWEVLQLRLLETDNPYLEYADAKQPIAELNKSFGALKSAVKKIESLKGTVGRGHGEHILDELRDRYNERPVSLQAMHWDELFVYFDFIAKNIESLFEPAPKTRAEPYHITINGLYDLFSKHGLNTSVHENCPALAFMKLISQEYPGLVFPSDTIITKSEYDYLVNVVGKSPKKSKR